MKEQLAEENKSFCQEHALTEERKHVFVEQLVSSLDLPPLPQIFFDRHFIVQEASSTPEACTAEDVLEESAKVIEVPRGVLPPDYARFEVAYPRIKFDPDVFQKQCFYYIAKGENIFVTAHTSSGKTLIAEFTAYLAEQHSTKMIYTSPIKALSNQKYREFSEKFESVGILTGDAQINSEAKCVVMTTEILRNMLYRTSDILNGVEFIVFDEIHYLGDRERGVVWEEVIIMLPKHIVLVFLSATSPNAKDMSQWISATKGKDTYLIGTEKRAVDLEHCVYFRRELYTLCAGGVFHHEEYVRAKNTGVVEVFKDKQAQTDALKAKEAPRLKKRAVNVLESPMHIAQDLIARNLAPIVFFDFSKSRIEQSFSLCTSLDLTTAEEKLLIKDFINSALEKLPAGDRELPQIAFVVPLLINGVAMHHSGLLPILKEIVELLFTTGALRVIFATETLAMGLNMPARTVVLRTLKKYNPETQTYGDITTNEYTQMAGRAGRRGYDIKGTVITEIGGQEMVPESLLIRLQTGQPCKIESKFYITPRMILKLLRAKTLTVEEMVRLSFGKSRTEREMRRVLQKQKTAQAELASIEHTCERCRKDIMEYIDTYAGFCQKTNVLYASLIVSHSGGSFGRRKQILTTPGYQVITARGTVSRVLGVRIDQAGQAVQLRVQDEFGIPRPVFVSTALSQASGEAVPVSSQSPEDAPEFPEKERERKRAGLSLLPGYLLNKKEYIAVEPTVREVPLSQVILALQSGEMAEFSLTNFSLMETYQTAKRLWNSLDGFACTECPMFAEHYSEHLEEYLIRKEIKETDAVMRSTIHKDLSGNNYFGYLMFLQKMEYIDTLNNLKLKGRIACEFNSVCCILATELLFSPLSSSLSPSELIIGALALTFYEKYQLEEEVVHPRHVPRVERVKQLKASMGVIDTICEEVHQVFKEYRMGVIQPNHAVSGEIQMWLEGASLADIIAASSMSEGVIVKYIKKAVELCTEFTVAARVLGSTALSEEIQKIEETLKRGIVFTPSLYYG
ncbi:antiviral helicase SKI2 [Nematocida sp. AWRm77]|nr:antiviral helicase SKI2 [Nematocida sp. AWRm77]